MRVPKTAGESPFPTVKALAAMVSANDDRAVRYVLSALRENAGNVTATAAAIGCSVRSLYVWRDSVPRLKEGFEQYALGRTGAGVNVTKARLAKHEAEAQADDAEPAREKAPTPSPESTPGKLQRWVDEGAGRKLVRSVRQTREGKREHSLECIERGEVLARGTGPSPALASREAASKLWMLTLRKQSEPTNPIPKPVKRARKSAAKKRGR